MRVAAIDVSDSTYFEEIKIHYPKNVIKVLSSVKTPISVIRWGSKADVIECKKVNSNILPKEGYGGTYPQEFVKLLPTTEAIDLYVFTDGWISDSAVKECQAMLKNVTISNVYLYYVGLKKNMNLKFTDVFRKFPFHVNYLCPDEKFYVGRVDPKPIDFDKIDFNYIMKDDSFKATVLTLINDPNQDKAKLKKEVQRVQTRILKECGFEDEAPLSISPYYLQRDIEGCISYVKTHAHCALKVDFQKKINETFELFDKNIDTYSLNVFNRVKKNNLKLPPGDENVECVPLTCDILYDNCKIPCIPIKVCKKKFWPDKNIIRNPFKLLESEEFIKVIENVIEPHIMDYGDTYLKLEEKNTSPFTRDRLRGVYILHNTHINPTALRKHNNYILSTLIQDDKLPGKSILWHIVFLYILATRLFEEQEEEDKKNIIFDEIRFLSEREKYFITLNPFVNPLIVDNLTVCFWYIACISHRAFPNSKKNLLRTSDFRSGVFLDFYKNVFDKNYDRPKEMPLWQLWYKLCSGSIFDVLSEYYRHEKVTASQTVLFRERLPNASKLLDLETVWNVYMKFKESRRLNFYEDLSTIENRTVDSTEEESETDTLKHVRINPKTCHPYVKCLVSGKHWKICAGDYNPVKHSYLKLFKNFCQKYKTYPESAGDLMGFLNEHIFQHNARIPEIFPLNLSDQMALVLDIFKEIMKTYTCDEYLKIFNEMSSEEIRLQYE